MVARDAVASSLRWHADRDAEDPELIERLLAALYRDGFAVLEAGISDPAACDATLSAMQPYLERPRRRRLGVRCELARCSLEPRRRGGWLRTRR